MRGTARVMFSLRRALPALAAVVLVPSAALLTPAAAFADGGPGQTVNKNGIKEVVNNNGIHEQFTIGGNTNCTVYHRWGSRPGVTPTGSWTPLGGQSCAIPQDGLDVGKNQNGRLEVFVVGADNGIWHIWQTVAGSGPWSNWAGLGRPGGFLAVGGPRVTSEFSGSSEIYVSVGDQYHRSWQRHQNQPNCCSWTDWYMLVPA